jgi:hypothetical protein
MPSDRNNDDIAAALHGIHADDSVASHEHRTEPQPPPPPSPVPAAQPPKAAKARPAAPAAPQPAAPARPAASSRPLQPGAQRPSAPGARPATPSARPAAPQQSPAASEEMYVEDDPDEIAGLPAATLDYRAAARPTARLKRKPFFKTRGFRQTMIPILLTTGVASLAFAMAHWVVDENAPLARLPGWASPVLIVMALLLIASAVMNMLFVRAELTKPK